MNQSVDQPWSQTAETRKNLCILDYQKTGTSIKSHRLTVEALSTQRMQQTKWVYRHHGTWRSKQSSNEKPTKRISTIGETGQTSQLAAFINNIDGKWIDKFDVEYTMRGALCFTARHRLAHFGLHVRHNSQPGLSSFVAPAPCQYPFASGHDAIQSRPVWPVFPSLSKCWTQPRDAPMHWNVHVYLNLLHRHAPLCGIRNKEGICCHFIFILNILFLFLRRVEHFYRRKEERKKQKRKKLSVFEYWSVECLFWGELKFTVS